MTDESRKSRMMKPCFYQFSLRTSGASANALLLGHQVGRLPRQKSDSARESRLVCARWSIGNYRRPISSKTIIVTSDWNNRLWSPRGTHHNATMYLGASQWACDVTLSTESSNDCFWLVNTANDGRVALPVCSDTATPVATSHQILNRSNVLRRNYDWPKSSCKVAQTGQLQALCFEKCRRVKNSSPR